MSTLEKPTLKVGIDKDVDGREEKGVADAVEDLHQDDQVLVFGEQCVDQKA